MVDPDDRVARAEPGAPWWRYERPPSNRPVAEVPAPAEPPDPEDPEGHDLTAESDPPAPIRRFGEVAPNGTALVVTGLALVVGLAVAARTAGVDHAGVVIFPLAGLLIALGFARRCARVRPEEPWLPRLIVWGVVFKLLASAARYLSFTQVYKSAGDAFIYDREGREFVAYWTGELATSPLAGLQISGSNMIRYLTGVVYFLFGRDLLAGFFLFGLLAVIGSYFWYRALVDAVPYADKRLALLFMLFAPSIVFWPSAVGKEALMQLGVGAMAWATSLALQGRLQRAIPLAVGGGWLLYIIRPHLLALVTVAAAVPYFIGRLRRSIPGAVSLRPVGMVIMGLLVVFTVAAGTRFVGIESLSIDSVEEQLAAQTESTAQGGSRFSTGFVSLTNPLFLPMGFATVLFRPFVFEARGLLPMLAAMEATVLLWLTFHRFGSIRLALRRCRQEPFILYCLMLLVFYSATFSSLANFGLLTRQRSLVLPALYALLALDPVRAKRWLQRQEHPEELPQWGSGVLVGSPSRPSAPRNGSNGRLADGSPPPRRPLRSAGQ